MSLRRIIAAALLTASVLTVTACGDDSGTGTPSQAEWGALGADEKATYEFVVPYGTSVRIDQGQVVDLMPRLLEVAVGDSIRITNQDGRDYMIGPFYVTAGQSLAMRFTHEGELSGVCSMNPEGEFVIKVS
jgi:plastocyanin